MPWRTFHSRPCSAGSWVKAAGSSSSSPAQTATAVRSRPARRSSAAPWNSARRAAAPSGRSRIPGGTPGWSWTERREPRSSSSRAAAPASFKGAMALQAACRSGKNSSPVTFTGRSGTVRSTASAMKASVPSEPTRRLRKIASGVAKSRKAFSE